MVGISHKLPVLPPAPGDVSVTSKHMNPSVRLAVEADVPAVMNLVEEARQWALQKGHRQTADACDANELRAEIERGELYVCEDPDIMASFSLRGHKPASLSRYELIPDVPAYTQNSLSLGRLVVTREDLGRRIGYCVLDKACEVAHGLGKSLLYLDCWAGNTKLRTYYICAGFTLLGILQRKDNENFRVAVYQRHC